MPVARVQLNTAKSCFQVQVVGGLLPQQQFHCVPVALYCRLGVCQNAVLPGMVQASVF